MRKPPHFFSLKRGVIRMSWNVVNLYNLAAFSRIPDFSRKTTFWQKWYAKRHFRAYFGAHMDEKQFKQTWKSESLPVLKSEKPLPMMQNLTMCAFERRLDIVIFRSCFAPSIFAAKRYVTMGNVKVNGVYCRMPSYSLNDGDVVTVDPNAILMLNNGVFTPRKFQQPWMFIPEYLEVDFNICATVFLRSPRLKENQSEIPSPFPPELHQLVHEYYSRFSKR